MELLKELVGIRGASSDESRIKQFIKTYVEKQKSTWENEVQIHDDIRLHDNLILTIGKPKTVVFAHIDTIGFSVGYDNELIKIGGPRIQDGYQLVGEDSFGEIETELFVIEHEDGTKSMKCLFERTIERGTILTFKVDFRETKNYIQSAYLDNRLGVWNALKLCETGNNVAFVFTTYEEHGGNSVSFCLDYLIKQFPIRYALISDITWITEGVVHGGGVAISMRDSCLPRKSFVDKIITLAKASGVNYQLEVESAGGSDGSVIQKSAHLIDWIFIGAAEDNVHTPDEKVYKSDIVSMLALYQYLVENL